MRRRTSTVRREQGRWRSSEQSSRSGGTAWPPRPTASRKPGSPAASRAPWKLKTNAFCKTQKAETGNADWVGEKLGKNMEFFFKVCCFFSLLLCYSIGVSENTRWGAEVGLFLIS